MNQVLSTRIPWIDISRGIGILLVLYGHALGSDKNRFLIYAFHMPLFFFLSGIVFKQGNTSLFAMLKKNSKAILLPYFVFALATYFLGLLIIPPDTLSINDVTKQLRGILYGSANEGYLTFNTALWFLPCLFVTKMSFSLLTRFVTKKSVLATILAIIAVFAYLFSVYFRETKLFFETEIAITGLVFFGAGYLWNQSEKLKKFMSSKKVLLLIISIILLLLFATMNFKLYGSQIDMRVNRLNDFYLFYLGAFSGIGMILFISMIIKSNKLLQYIGKHSILLFGWHTLLFTYFKHISFFAPVHYEFLTPTIHLTFATAIILLLQMLYLRTRKALSFQRIQKWIN